MLNIKIEVPAPSNLLGSVLWPLSSGVQRRAPDVGGKQTVRDALLPELRCVIALLSLGMCD